MSIATNIELGDDGIWSAKSVSKVSYPDAGNDLCFAIEDDSFWFKHRNACILEAINGFPPPGTILDLGGGNGYVARAIQAAGWDVILIEPGPQGARNAIGRGVRHVVRATFEDAGFVHQKIPAIGMFDVLEHIEDDHRFLVDAHRYLIPGGRLYLTVPAFNWLWSQEDVDGGHFRRYSVPALSRVLDRSGFDVELVTCFFGFVPLPALLLRALPYRLGLSRSARSVRDEHQVKNPIVARFIGRSMQREIQNIRSRRPKILGGSCLAVARKR